jgi:hypothetical protein
VYSGWRGLPGPRGGSDGVIDEALKCKDLGESRVLLFNLSGYDHLDLSAYLAGSLEGYFYPQDEEEMPLLMADQL